MIPDVSHEELRAAGFAPLRLEVSTVRRVFPKEVLLLHQPHLVSAAYQNLRTELLQSRSSGSPRSLLFTSTTAGEEKTLTAVNTAIALAQMGARVLLIDADLHQPACHTMLAMHHSFGLIDFLTGQGDLSELLRPTPIDHLVFLSAGSSAATPPEILGCKSMHTALPFLHKMYDYLVIDSPSLDSVSAALLLATMVDGVVLVVDSQHTPCQRVQDARQRLMQVNGLVLGVVLNKVDARSREYQQYVQHSQAAALQNGAVEEHEETTDGRIATLTSSPAGREREARRTG